MLPPPFDQDLGLAQRGEDLPVQQVIPELPVEGLAIAVLPGASGLDEQGADVEPGEPCPAALRTELGAVVGAQVGRTAPGDEQVREGCQDVIRRPLPSHPDGQRLPRARVHDREQPKGAAVVGAIGHRIVGPHVVRRLGP